MSCMRSILLLLVATLGMLGGDRRAQAQDYPPTDPPRIYTIPANVSPDEPFRIAIEALVVGGAIGPWDAWVDRDARIVYIWFDYFCGWICPGSFTPSMQTFYLNLPGLPQGDYVIRMTGGATVDAPFRIAAPAPASVPVVSFGAISALIALLLAAAIFQLRLALNGNEPLHG